MRSNHYQSIDPVGARTSVNVVLEYTKIAYEKKKGMLKRSSDTPLLPLSFISVIMTALIEERQEKNGVGWQ